MTRNISMEAINKTRRHAKFWITFTLLSAFLAYTLSVYTTGTAVSTSNPRLDVSAIRGKMLWQKYNCSSCHQLYGLGGFLGPDLTTVSSRKGHAYAKAIILGGTRRMPYYGLSDNEADDIIKFLSYVDSTASHYKTTSAKNVSY